MEIPDMSVRLLVAACVFAVTWPSQAQDNSGVALDLDETARISLDRQPLLQAQAANALAARESAIAAGQLPDPMLSGGLTDFTVTGPDRYTLRKETDTQFMVGVKQQFPG